MKRTFLSTRLLTALAGLALCAFSAPAYGTNATNARAEDEAAIRENVRQMEAGWNAKRGVLFAKPFTDDADYVVINGMYFKGRAAIEKAHQQIFDTFYKNTTISLSVRQIRFLRSDIALVHVSGHLEGTENEKQLASEASMTMVMTREKQGWQIAAFHNTQVVANQQR